MRGALARWTVAALLFIAGALIASWLVEQAIAHYKPTCSHATVYSGYVSGFGYTWKAVHFSIYGDYPDGWHDHGHKHYTRTPSNPTWRWKHNFITTNCAGH